MLALDVALAQDPPVERVASLSGLLLPESTESLKRFHGRALRPSGTLADGRKYFASHGYAHATRFFVSHGRGDTVLPFEAAEATRAELTQAELPVTCVPCDGGHEIPAEVVGPLIEFLFD
jgi:phospholipase/carboxylesterase